MNDGAATAHLTGRIDRDSGPLLDDVIEAARGASVLDLDFAGVDYINSSGIALLVGLLARARSSGTAIRAAGLTAHYRHIFDITRLSDFIEVVPPAAP